MMSRTAPHNGRQSIYVVVADLGVLPDAYEVAAHFTNVPVPIHRKIPQ